MPAVARESLIKIALGEWWWKTHQIKQVSVLKHRLEMFPKNGLFSWGFYDNPHTEKVGLELSAVIHQWAFVDQSVIWGPPKINARGFRRGSGTRKEHDSFQAMELGPVTRANDFPWTIFCQAWYSIPCNLDIASLNLWYPGMNPSQIQKLMLLSSWLKRHE